MVNTTCRAPGSSACPSSCRSRPAPSSWPRHSCRHPCWTRSWSTGEFYNSFSVFVDVHHSQSLHSYSEKSEDIYNNISWNIMMMLKVICLMVMMMVMVFTPDICHNHHNHWLCKTSVKFSNWNAKLLTHSVKHFTHSFVASQLLSRIYTLSSVQFLGLKLRCVDK